LSEKQYTISTMTAGNSWRLFEIFEEFQDGVEVLNDLFPAVTIFGSDRVRSGDETYKKAFQFQKSSPYAVTILSSTKDPRYGGRE